MTNTCVLILLTVITTLNVETAKILAVFPTPAYSHHTVFQPYIQELVKRGHQLVVITPIPIYEKSETPENLRQIDISKVSKIGKDSFPTAKGFKKMEDFYNFLHKIMDAVTKRLINQLQMDEVREIMEDRNAFDIVIVEDWCRSFLGIAHYFNATVLKLSSFATTYDNHNMIGPASHPIYFPTQLSHKIYHLTIWDEAMEIYHRYRIQNFVNDRELVETEILRKLGEDMKTLEEMRDRVGLVVTNVHRLWELNRPLTLNMVSTGALNMRPMKELPKDLKTYLDSATNGVIYVSFGSYIKIHLPEEQMKVMIAVLSRMPCAVLLKWDQEELPIHADNIRVSKWFPQQDLLRHRNIKLFVTQGGLQSIDEAIDAGVPMLGMPLIFDQYVNVENIVRLKIGLKLPLHSITEQQFEQALQRLIDDGSFRQNLQQLRILLSDLPQSSMQRAVWWTKHAARHGARHLRSPAHNIPVYEYLEVELVAIVAASTAAALLLFAAAMYYCTRIVWKSLRCLWLRAKAKLQ